MAAQPKEEKKHDSLVDLHVYIVPLELWLDKYRKARNTAVLESLSAGFIRVQSTTCLHFIRDSIVDQIGTDLIPEKYIFLRSVGRCLAVVNRTQELVMTAADFVQPSAHSELLLLPTANESDELENPLSPLQKENLSPKENTKVRIKPKISNASLNQYQNGGESTADEQNYVHFTLSPPSFPPQSQQHLSPSTHAQTSPNIYQNLEYPAESSSDDDDAILIENDSRVQTHRQERPQINEDADASKTDIPAHSLVSVVQLADEAADQEELQARILERFEKENQRLDGDVRPEMDDDYEDSDEEDDFDFSKKINILSQFEVKNEIAISENTFMMENTEVVETNDPYGLEDEADKEKENVEAETESKEHVVAHIEPRNEVIQDMPIEMPLDISGTPVLAEKEVLKKEDEEEEFTVRAEEINKHEDVAPTTLVSDPVHEISIDPSTKQENVVPIPLDDQPEMKKERLQTKREPRLLKNEPKNMTISSINNEGRRKPKTEDRKPDNEETQKLKAAQIEDLKRQIALIKAERETNEKSIRTFAKKRGDVVRENNERLIGENKAWKQKYLVEKERTTQLQYEIEKVKKTIERQYQKSIPLPNASSKEMSVRKNKDGSTKVEAPSEKSNQRNLVLKLQNEINELSVRHEIIKKQLMEESTLKAFAEQELKDLRFNAHKGKRNLKKSLNEGTQSV